jgi:predicted dehydrogenase
MQADARRSQKSEGRAYGLPQLPPHSRDRAGQENDREGAIGDVYHYYARYAQDWIVDPDFPLVWRLQKGVSGSGAHGDINAHIIDLARYLVGEFKEVCGLMNTFIKERPLQDQSGKGDGLGAKGGKKIGKVTVDDAAICIGRFANGALANLEATRFALGRKTTLPSKSTAQRVRFTSILKT